MSSWRVTVTGATGLIGAALVEQLRRRDAQVTVLARDPASARTRLGEVEAIAWNALAAPAPEQALAGRDAVVHLAGAPVARRWSEQVKQAIRDSRVLGTRNLLAGLRAAEQQPRCLVSSSAVGYYGAHGEEPLDEDAPPGRDFLADVCVEWEREAARARELGMRVALVRTGVVLDRSGGALAKMLPPFRLGVGGPVAGGRQYVSWIHLADQVGLILAALQRDSWEGPFNATAPQPVENRELARVLGRVLHRPAVLPTPAFALRALYGEMAAVLTSGVRAVPAKALVLGYEFQHPHLEGALRAALG